MSKDFLIDLDRSAPLSLSQVRATDYRMAVLTMDYHFTEFVKTSADVDLESYSKNHFMIYISKLMSMLYSLRLVNDTTVIAGDVVSGLDVQRSLLDELIREVTSPNLHIGRFNEVAHVLFLSSRRFYMEVFK